MRRRPICRRSWRPAGNKRCAVNLYLRLIDRILRCADGTYAVRELYITDKHGKKHTVYNAKVNIFLGNDDPNFLGLQNNDASIA